VLLLARIILPILLLVQSPQVMTSGRPPINALQRTDPKVYDIQFGVNLFTEIPPGDASLRLAMSVEDAPIVLPIISRGPWSKADLTTVAGRVWIDARGGASLTPRLDPNKGFGMTFAVLSVTARSAQSIRWEMTYRMQCWRSALDDRVAARATWPQAWPEECQDSLKPQLFIESDDQRFIDFVAKVSDGQLRSVPPFLAAKDLIRATINALRVNGNGLDRGLAGLLRGFEMVGAAKAMEAGVGSPADLVAACVAVLRAGGIPARVVVGVDRNLEDGKRPPLSAWAEFYLPDSGWVPFDPMRMRGNNIARLNVRDPWPWLGTIRDMNDWIPLSYSFHPPNAALITHGRPCVWGWDPRPAGVPGPTQQYVTISTVSRGNGVEDPQ